MRPKVSIVVAAYNIEKYIERCLRSLVNQTLKEIEVLVVNDGSIDRTEIITKEFEKDSRFKVITQENGGLSSARNTGIKNASGKYIAFLDGDDYVCKEMYEELYDKIKKEKSDLVICGFYKIWENDKFIEKKRKKFNVNKKILKGDVIGNFLSKHDEPFTVAWNKLYNLEIIVKNNIYFENPAFFEDVGFMPRYLYYTKKISVVNKMLYFYIQRSGSITKSYNPIIEKSFEKTISLINKFYYQKAYNKYLEVFELRLLIYILNYSLRNSISSENIVNKILKFRKCWRLAPIKHKIAYLLIRIKLYNKIFLNIRK